MKTHAFVAAGLVLAAAATAATPSAWAAYRATVGPRVEAFQAAAASYPVGTHVHGSQVLAVAAQGNTTCTLVFSARGSGAHTPSAGIGVSCAGQGTGTNALTASVLPAGMHGDPSLFWSDGVAQLASSGTASHFCALAAPSGVIRCWGSNSVSQCGASIPYGWNLGNTVAGPWYMPPIRLGVPDIAVNPPVNVRVGGGHTCVAFAAGQIKCFGDNSKLQLGLPSNFDEVEDPSKIPFISFDVPFTVSTSGYPTDTRTSEDAVTDMCLTGESTVVLFASGRLKAFGSGPTAGDGSSSTARVAPTAAPFLDFGSRVIKLTCGYTYVAVLLENGEVRTWGKGDLFQLGWRPSKFLSSPVPAVVSLPLDFGDDAAGDPVVDITAAGGYMCSLHESGRLKCWGRVVDLGYGPTVGSTRGPWEVPFMDVTTLIPGGDKLAKVALGATFMCGLTEQGRVYCWGQVENYGSSSYFGIRGRTPAATASLVTIDVSVFPGRVTDLVVSAETVCIKFDGSGAFACWGRDNIRGRGTGDIDVDASLPYPGMNGVVRFLAEGSNSPPAVIALYKGSSFMSVKLEDGSIRFWGGGAPFSMDSSDPTLGGVSSPSLVARPYAFVNASAPAPIGYSGTVAVSRIVSSSLSNPYYACVLFSAPAGRVKCAGTTDSPLPYPPSLVDAIAATSRATLATENFLPFPFVPDFDGSSAATFVQDVTASSVHLCFSLASGAVVCGGSNEDGQSGNKPVSSEKSTYPFDPSTMRVVSSLAFPPGPAGSTAVFNATVAATDKPAVELGSSYWHTCALSTVTGCLKCFGSNYNYQLGAPSVPYSSSLAAEDAACIDPGAGVVTAFGTSSEGTCAIFAASLDPDEPTAGVKCWGYGNMLGYGPSFTSIDDPTTMPFLSLSIDERGSVLEVALAKDIFTCIRYGAPSYGMLCWGRAEYTGQPPSVIGSASYLSDAGELPLIDFGPTSAERAVLAMALGEDTVCALLGSTTTGRGDVRCFSSRPSAQAGIFKAGPLQTPAINDAAFPFLTTLMPSGLREPFAPVRLVSNGGSGAGTPLCALSVPFTSVALNRVETGTVPGLSPEALLLAEARCWGSSLRVPGADPGLDFPLLRFRLLAAPASAPIAFSTSLVEITSRGDTRGAQWLPGWYVPGGAPPSTPGDGAILVQVVDIQGGGYTKMEDASASAGAVCVTLSGSGGSAPPKKTLCWAPLFPASTGSSGPVPLEPALVAALTDVQVQGLPLNVTANRNLTVTPASVAVGAKVGWWEPLPSAALASAVAATAPRRQVAGAGFVCTAALGTPAAVAVSCTGSNTAVVRGSGGVVTFGSRYAATHNVTALAAGSSHVCAVLRAASEDTLLCWGAAGALGVATSSSGAASPAASTPLDFGVQGLRVLQLACGGGACCALVTAGARTGRALRCWGAGQSRLTPGAAAVTPEDGLAWGNASSSSPEVRVAHVGSTWGYNGFPIAVPDAATPAIGVLSAGTQASPLDSTWDVIADVSVGDGHACILWGYSGASSCWGSNAANQLGLRSATLIPSSLKSEAMVTAAAATGGTVPLPPLPSRLEGPYALLGSVWSPVAFTAATHAARRDFPGYPGSDPATEASLSMYNECTSVEASTGLSPFGPIPFLGDTLAVAAVPVVGSPLVPVGGAHAVVAAPAAAALPGPFPGRVVARGAAVGASTLASTSRASLTCMQCRFPANDTTNSRVLTSLSSLAVSGSSWPACSTISGFTPLLGGLVNVSAVDLGIVAQICKARVTTASFTALANKETVVRAAGTGCATDVPPGLYTSVYQDLPTAAEPPLVCDECTPGRFCRGGVGTPCPAGWYGIGYGRTTVSACKPCPKGYYSDMPGSSSCDACAPGSYAAAAATPACKLCAPGYYQPNATATTCVACPLGTYTTTPGATECVRAPAGYYVDAPAARAPTPCPAGTFSDAIAATSNATCFPCPQGTFNPTAGQASAACIACPAGYAGVPVSVTGGAKSDTAGCYACPPGTFTSAPRSATCAPCGAGLFSAAIGATACDACPFDSYRRAMAVSSPVIVEAGALPSGGYQLAQRNGTQSGLPLTLRPAAFQLAFFVELATSVSACTPCPSGTRTTTTGAAGEQACVPLPAFTCPTGMQPRGLTAPKSEADCVRVDCSALGQGLVPTADGTSCVGCGVGFVGIPPNCKPCAGASSSTAGRGNVSAALGLADGDVAICPGGTLAPVYVPRLFSSSLAALVDAAAASSLAVNGTSIVAVGPTPSPVPSSAVSPSPSTSAAAPVPPKLSSVLASLVSQAGPLAGASVAGGARPVDLCTLPAYLLSATSFSSSEQLVQGVALETVASAAALAADAEAEAGSTTGAGTSSGLLAEYIVLISLGVACFVVFTLSLARVRRVAGYFSTFLVRVDAFGLAHSYRNAEFLQKRNTTLGGAFTVLGACTLVVLAASLIAERVRNNNLSRQYLLPVNDTTFGLAGRLPVGIASATAPAADGGSTYLGAAAARLGLSSSGSGSSGLLPGAASSLDPFRVVRGTVGRLSTAAGASVSSSASLFASVLPTATTTGAALTPSGVHIVLVAGGEGGKCMPTSWSSRSLLRGTFTYTQPLGACGNWSSAVFSCPDCVFAAGSTLDVVLPWSCQLLAVRGVSVAADGVVTEIDRFVSSALASTPDAAVKPLLKASWSLSPMLELREDQIFNKQTRGYRLLQGAVTVTTAATTAATTLSLQPLAASVTLSVDLSPPSLYTSVIITPKQTVLQLICAIIGLASILQGFAFAFQMAEAAMVRRARGKGAVPPPPMPLPPGLAADPKATAAAASRQSVLVNTRQSDGKRLSLLVTPGALTGAAAAPSSTAAAAPPGSPGPAAVLAPIGTEASSDALASALREEDVSSQEQAFAYNRALSAAESVATAAALAAASSPAVARASRRHRPLLTHMPTQREYTSKLSTVSKTLGAAGGVSTTSGAGQQQLPSDTTPADWWRAEDSATVSTTNPLQTRG